MEAMSERWTNVNCSIQTCDANIVKGNSKNVAVITSMGKSLTILKQSQHGRVEPTHPVFSGHKGEILDVEFMPYYDDYFATASADGTIKLWQIPENQTENISTPLVTLEGHQKKVNIIDFNPSAQGVLVSTGLDRHVRVWDVQNGIEKYSILGSQKDYSVDVQFKDSGDLIGSTWKDKFYRIIDPRQNRIAHEFVAHAGTKPSKFSWMGDYSYFLTAGFSQAQQQREFKFWDIKKPDTPVATYSIDKDMSVIYPYFDADLDLLYFTGKGDSMIRYFEFTNGKFEKYGNDHRCTVPGKSYSFIKKYALDTNQSEIARCLQVTNTNEVQQISVVQPKRNVGFSEEIYPDTAMQYGQSADSFFNGKDAQFQKFSMNPDQQVNVNFSQTLSFVQGEKPSLNQKPLAPQPQTFNQHPQQQPQQEKTINQPPQQQEQQKQESKVEQTFNQPPQQQEQQKQEPVVEQTFNQPPQQQEQQKQEHVVEQTFNQPPQQQEQQKQEPVVEQTFNQPPQQQQQIQESKVEQTFNQPPQKQEEENVQLQEGSSQQQSKNSEEVQLLKAQLENQKAGYEAEISQLMQEIAMLKNENQILKDQQGNACSDQVASQITGQIRQLRQLVDNIETHL